MDETQIRVQKPATEQRETRLIMLLLLGFLWLGTMYAFIRSNVVWQPDTPSFFWSDISFSGESIRAWPSVLLFSALPTNGLRGLAQILIYGGAWSLILVFIVSYYSGVIRALLGITVVALSLTPLFFEWNITLLAESLTISFLIGATGLALLSLITDSRPRRFLLVMGAAFLVSLAAVNRLPAFLFFLPVFFLLIAGFRSEPSGRKRWIVGIGICVLLLLYPLWYNARTDDWWSRGHAWWVPGFPERVDSDNSGASQGLSRSAWNFVILSSVNASGGGNEFSDALFDSVVDEAGPCITRFRGQLLAPTTGVAMKMLDTGVRGVDTSPRNPFDQIRRIALNCPESANWLNENFSSYYVTFLIDNPRLATQHLLWTFRSITHSDGFNPVDTVLPLPIQQLIEGSQSGNSLNTPLNAWIILTLLLVGSVLLVRIRERSRVWNLALLTTVTALGSIVVSNLMIAYDLDRITSPSVAVLFISLALTVAESARLLYAHISSMREDEPR